VVWLGSYPTSRRQCCAVESVRARLMLKCTIFTHIVTASASGRRVVGVNVLINPIEFCTVLQLLAAVAFLTIGFGKPKPSSETLDVFAPACSTCNGVRRERTHTTQLNLVYIHINRASVNRAAGGNGRKVDELWRIDWLCLLGFRIPFHHFHPNIDYRIACL
jgi:hypothetical protein